MRFAVGQPVTHRLRRIMQESTLQNMTYDESGSYYGGLKGKYYLVTDSTYGYEPKEFWTNFIINHYFAGAASYAGTSGEVPNGNTIWTNIVVFGDFAEYQTKSVAWGPKIQTTAGSSSLSYNWDSTVHLAVVDKEYDSTTLKWGFTNSSSTSDRLLITETNKNKLDHYAYGKVNPNNSTWGWVRMVDGTGTEYVTLPGINVVKYDLKKPKTVTAKESDFISQDLSKLLRIPIRLYGGMPIVKCSTQGKLTFKLKFSCTKSGVVARFGFRKNQQFDNSTTIQNYISSCNLSTADFNYNLDEQKVLDVSMNVDEGDIIYLKINTSNLIAAGGVTYRIYPSISDMYITPSN